MSQPDRGHPEWTVGELAVALSALEKSMEAQFAAVLSAVTAIHTIDPARYADRQGVIDERLTELRRDHDRDITDVREQVEKAVITLHGRITDQATKRDADRKWLIGTVIATATVIVAIAALFFQK